MRAWHKQVNAKMDDALLRLSRPVLLPVIKAPILKVPSNADGCMPPLENVSYPLSLSYPQRPFPHSDLYIRPTTLFDLFPPPTSISRKMCRLHRRISAFTLSGMSAYGFPPSPAIPHDSDSISSDPKEKRFVKSNTIRLSLRR